MKVCIYARVSRQEQNLDTQLSALKEFCKRNNYEIYQEYEDIISGKTDKRGGFDLMLKDMRNGKFDAVIVYKLDRIGRSLQHLLNLFAEFDSRKIEFISITQNINTTTAEGRLFLKMLMLLAEYERELIVARTQARLDYLQEQISKKGFAVTKTGRKITSLGRPLNSKDKKVRKKSGYLLRYANK
jgi:putative DNA-invertase from lambdoid prophage Rac